jgi:hypothetical protein
MATFWLLLAALLLFTYSYQRRRLRRQTRAINQMSTRYDEFVIETHRLRRQSDREVDRALRENERSERK